MTISPDASLLNILLHGMRSHPELDPVEYLDIIEHKTTIVTNPRDIVPVGLV